MTPNNSPQNAIKAKMLRFLHLMGLITLFSAVISVNSVRNDSWFVGASMLAATLGNTLSLYLRNKRATSRLIELMVFGICLAVYLKVMYNPYDLSSLNAGNVDSPQVKFAELFVWIECLRSFTLTSDEAVIFTGVPTIASIGLVATDNINTEVMLYFALYLVAMTTMLAQYAGMRLFNTQGVSESMAAIYTRFRLALMVALLAFVVGVSASRLVRIATGAALGQVVKFPAGDALGLPSVRRADTSVPVMQGPAFLRDIRVLAVKADRGYYLRGNVYATYSGQAWDNLTENDREPVFPPKPNKSNYLRQLVIVQPGFQTNELYAAAEPHSIFPIPRRSVGRLLRNHENCWRTMGIQPERFRYEVISYLPEDSPAKLAKSSVKYPSEVRKAYLQTVSLSMDNPIRALAKRVTKDCVNPYEKAMAIESYLSREYRYDLNPPKVPRGRDVVEYFLFDSRRGYCTAFASAMVIMLREMGIPARLATGYAPGRYDPVSRMFVIREKDSHAWTEVYFPKCGWIAFDPSGAEEERPRAFWEIFKGELSKTVKRIAGKRSWMITALALMLLLVGLSRPDLTTRKITLKRRTSIDPMRRKALSHYIAMCRAASRVAVRTQCQTPSEYAALVRATPGLSESAGPLIDGITKAFEDIKYGGREPDSALLREMKSQVSELRSHLRFRS